MPAVKKRFTAEEHERRGDSIYHTKIEPNLKPNDKGKFVAIDVGTGEYALSTDQLEASDMLRSRVPDAQIWFVRVGSRHVHSLGGRELRTKS